MIDPESGNFKVNHAMKRNSQFSQKLRMFNLNGLLVVLLYFKRRR